MRTGSRLSCTSGGTTISPDPSQRPVRLSHSRPTIRCAGATFHGFSPTPGSATKPQRGRGQRLKAPQIPRCGFVAISPGLDSVAGRYREALEELRGLSDDFFAMRVAAQVRLGETEAARAAVADYVKRGGQDTIAKEESWPQIEPDRTQYLNSLRKARISRNS